MKKHIKKLVALALATLMLLMTACGTQNPSEPSDTDGAETLDNTEKGSDVVEKGRRGQLINMLSGITEDKKVATRLATYLEGLFDKLDGEIVGKEYTDALANEDYSAAPSVISAS